MRIIIVEVEKIRKIRHECLRQGKPYSSTLYKKDFSKETIHIAVEKEKKIISCATIYPENNIEKGFNKAYRLRGMATEEGKRRQGYGKKIVKKIEKILIEKKQNYIWCKARIEALKFYKNLGFLVVGEKFNIKDIGPHYIMYKKIKKLQT